MQLQVEVSATYQAPGISDADVVELELGFLRRELKQLFGGDSSFNITLRWQGKDGIWKTLRG